MLEVIDVVRLDGEKMFFFDCCEGIVYSDQLRFEIIVIFFNIFNIFVFSEMK